jgi:hypothetical protein
MQIYSFVPSFQYGNSWLATSDVSKQEKKCHCARSAIRTLDPKQKSQKHHGKASTPVRS